jgi:hypothetical protein
LFQASTVSKQHYTLLQESNITSEHYLQVSIFSSDNSYKQALFEASIETRVNYYRQALLQVTHIPSEPYY